MPIQVGCKLDYRCAVFEKHWVLAYQIFDEGIIIQEKKISPGTRIRSGAYFLWILTDNIG